MTGHIERLLQFYIRDKAHHEVRLNVETTSLADFFEQSNMPDEERALQRLNWVLKAEVPVVFSHDRVAMLRTVTQIPEIYSQAEQKSLHKNYYIHEQGKICNINPDYLSLMHKGFDAKRVEIKKILQAKTPEDARYLEIMLCTLDSIENFARRYRAEARKVGNKVVEEVFTQIPQKEPRSFLEALQFLRLLHYCLWCSFNYHNTLGRVDQYLLPYLEKDLQTGLLTEESALELLEEFFISCNKDSDLYTGMQQGDNGQSVVLGGLTEQGEDSFNLLSELCLKASLELKLIDPKINLRVHKNTPISVYQLGTELTKQGLGFPQYSNDDVVIPALLKWGYQPEDAYNYVVAACWEFIIPGKGMDIPNIDGFSFAEVVIDVLPSLQTISSFAELLEIVKEKIHQKIQGMVPKYRNIYMEPSPLMSMMMYGCIENASDVSKGCKYNNFGIHGTGLSTAVDSLAAINKYVFQESSVSVKELLEALEDDYIGHVELANMLRYEGPKMGDDEDATDGLATLLLDTFADALEGIRNDRGGIYRPGTGSAMYYIWHSKSLPATPDGRRNGEELACNYSPSIFSQCKGPISIIKSFSKPNLVRVANGGPLTLELHDTVFRNAEGSEKVAALVKAFIDMGGHQLQLNAVNLDTLLEAKKKPEQYRNLIVRVWGWSGYFVELDEVYQNHIIKRAELNL